MECQTVVAFFPAYRGDQRDASPEHVLQLIVQDVLFFFTLIIKINTENIEIYYIGMSLKVLNHPGQPKVQGLN